MRNTPGFLIV